MDDITIAYRKLNQSFRKTLIFHIGIDAGFFAEYTYLANAMLYCLQHQLQFKLYSADANFGWNKGWSDYFMPFCEEVTDSFHHTYNVHPIPSWKKLLSSEYKHKKRALLKWKLKTTYRHFMGSFIAQSKFGKRVKLNHNVCFDHSQHFNIPELGINGDYIHAFNKIVDITWRFNEETETCYQELKKKLLLPPNYIGCQVRGGDKITETQLISPTHYLRIIQEKTTTRNVFVLTDDYQIFQSLQTGNSELHWFTLCSSDEAGYVNSTFTQTNNLKKREQMMRFLASMQLLLNSSLFVGSITTGPSLFLLKKLYPRVCLADCTPDDFKKAVALPIDERSKLVEKYLTLQESKRNA